LPVGVVDVEVGVVFGALVALLVGRVVGLVFGFELKAPEKTTTTGTSMIIINITARIANSFLRDFAEGGGGGGGGKSMLSLNFRVRLFFNIKVCPHTQELNILLGQFLFKTCDY
jgi:hypothetical protein